MIDPIVFFELLGEDRLSVKIKLTGKESSGFMEILVRSPAKTGDQRWPGAVYCVPYRDYEVIQKLLPEDVTMQEIPKADIESLFGVRIFTPEMDLPEPPDVEAVNILAMDLFQGHPKVMRKAEKELRGLRMGLLKKEIACTLSVACSVNSSVFHAYNKSHFENFERMLFPLSIRQLKRNNLLISMEGASSKKSAIWPGFKAITG